MTRDQFDDLTAIAALALAAPLQPLAEDDRHASRDQRAAAPALPIETAPAQPDVESCLCLLFPGPPRYPPEWTIGLWSGTGWCDRLASQCFPTHWAPLPPLPPRRIAIRKGA